MCHLKPGQKKKGQQFIDDYVAFTINSTKSIGLKVINAGGTESFKRGCRDNFNLDDIVPEYGVSSREIVDSLCNSIKNLKDIHDFGRSTTKGAKLFDELTINTKSKAADKNAPKIKKEPKSTKEYINDLRKSKIKKL